MFKLMFLGPLSTGSSPLVWHRDVPKGHTDTGVAQAGHLDHQQAGEHDLLRESNALGLTQLSLFWSHAGSDCRHADVCEHEVATHVKPAVNKPDMLASLCFCRCPTA